MHWAQKLHALTPNQAHIRSFAGSVLNEGLVAETKQFNLLFPN